MGSPRESSRIVLKDHLIIAARTLLLAIHVGTQYQDEETIKRVIQNSFNNAIEDLENFENHPDAYLVDIVDPDDGLIPAKPIVNNLIRELKDNRERYINDDNYTNEDAFDFFQTFVVEKLLLFQTRASMILALQEEYQGQDGEFERVLLERGLREAGIKSRKRTKNSHRKRTKNSHRKRTKNSHRKRTKNSHRKRRSKKHRKSRKNVNI